MQVEKVEFPSLHHLDAEIDSLICRKFRIVLENIRSHCVGIGLDNTRNYEKQAPEKTENAHKEKAPDIAEVAVE